MRTTNFIYAILNIDMLDVLGMDKLKVRLNNNSTKFIFKTYKEEPRITNTPLYTKKAIKKLLNTDEWKTHLNTM